MKKKLLLGLGLLLSLGTAKAQFTPYNRVINVDLDTTAITYGYASTQTGTSLKESPSLNQFFPHPAGSYIARALFAATATPNAQFTLGNSNGILTMKNPTAGLIKSSIYKIQNASAIAKFAFDLDLTNYTGLASFVISFGNNAATDARLLSSSTSYANVSNDIFGAFRIVKSGSLITQYRNAAGDASVALTAVNSLIKPGVSQRVEVFVNSSSANTSYIYNATSVALVANTYHVYVGGVKYAETFPKNGNGSTSYSQSALDALTFEFNNNATQETVSIANLSIIYPSATDPTLPVSLTSFTGKLNNNAVDLKWSTASEQNNSHFDILRSADAKSFTLLDRVEGNVNTNEPKEYNYQDRNPLSGTNYYQLKQFDLDGKENVIDRIVVVKTILDNADFTVFINQDNKLNASISSESKTNAVIAVFDIAGNELIKENISLEKGNNTFVKHLPFLAKGVYVLRLSSEGKTKSTKFVK